MSTLRFWAGRFALWFAITATASLVLIAAVYLAGYLHGPSTPTVCTIPTR